MSSSSSRKRNAYKEAFPYKEPSWSQCYKDKKFVLRMCKDSSIGKIELFDKAFYTFGRSQVCDIKSDHMSEYHAVLQFDKDGCAFLYDHGGTSGTYLNDSLIAAEVYHRLSDGDEFHFGSSTSAYTFEQAPQSMIPVDISGDFLMKYEIKKGNVDFFEGEVYFSSCCEAIEQFKFQDEVIEQFKFLRSCQSEYVVCPLFLDVNKTKSQIAIENCYTDFETWVNQNTITWDNVRKIFIDITRGLDFLYNQRKRFHGNLLRGIGITKQDRAVLRMMRTTLDEKVGIKKDVQDLQKLERLISKSHLKRYLNFPEDDVSAFFRLIRLPFQSANVVWILNHPITWDNTQKVLFIKKLDFMNSISTTFKSSMDWSLKNGLLKSWWKKVPNCGPLHMTYDKNKNNYVTEESIIRYARNVLEHFNENNRFIQRRGTNISSKTPCETLDELLKVFPSLCFELYDNVRLLALNKGRLFRSYEDEKFLKAPVL